MSRFLLLVTGLLRQFLGPAGFEFLRLLLFLRGDHFRFDQGTGAGMRLHFDFAPMNVSFANVEMREVSGPATNVTGYFVPRGDVANYHNAYESYIGINGSNRLGGVDTAAVNLAGYAQPWSAGGRDWVIPNRFRVVGEAGEGHVDALALVAQAIDVMVDAAP